MGRLVLLSFLLALVCIIVVDFADGKKGASNRVPLGTVRVSNIKRSQDTRLSGPALTLLEKSEQIEAAKQELQRKLENKAKTDVIRQAAVQERKKKEMILARKIKSGKLYRAIAAVRGESDRNEEDE